MLQKNVQVNRKILATPSMQYTLYIVLYIHFTLTASTENLIQAAISSKVSCPNGLSKGWFQCHNQMKQV